MVWNIWKKFYILGSCQNLLILLYVPCTMCSRATPRVGFLYQLYNLFDHCGKAQLAVYLRDPVYFKRNIETRVSAWHLGALVKVGAKWESWNYEEWWIGLLCSNKHPVHKNKRKCEFDERNGSLQTTPCPPPKILILNIRICGSRHGIVNVRFHLRKNPNVKIMLDLVTQRSYGRRLGEALYHGVTSNRLAASSVETWAVLGYS